MEELLFGTGGVPHSAVSKSTVGGIGRIAELELGCMEMEFVHGVRMKEADAQLVAETAGERGIRLSAHGPYYINLNAHEPEKITASQQRIFQSARIVSLCGGRTVVFHAGFYLGDPPEQTYEIVKKHLREILERMKEEGLDGIWLRPEVTGKPTQFGSLEELVSLCTEVEGLAPCIDFAHLHARNGGKYNSYDEFSFVFRYIEDKLGREYIEDMHIHLPGIDYGPKGEIKHLDLKDSDLRYEELLQAMKDHGVKGLVICESPNLEEDAILLRDTYRAL